MLYALTFGSNAAALELEFPGYAELVSRVPATVAQHPVATAGFDGRLIPTLSASGHVTQFTWQISGAVADTLAATLHAQIEAQGYAVPFACAAQACGGFDFRHGLPVGNPPEMHVDLGNFHYITATRDGEDGTHYAALMISQGGDTGFVHLALIQPETEDVPAPVVQSTRSPDLELENGDMIATLIAQGSIALDDLEFETGASALTGDTYVSLEELAAFLNADPDRSVVLVGHTDNLGSLSGNIALSEARAAAVRDFLLTQLGVSGDQVTAEGIGYLAPRATNDTPDGRDANRRVEVVLASP